VARFSYNDQTSCLVNKRTTSECLRVSLPFKDVIVYYAQCCYYLLCSKVVVAYYL